MIDSYIFPCQWNKQKTFWDCIQPYALMKWPKIRKISLHFKNFIPWEQILEPILLSVSSFFSNNDSFSYFSCQWNTRKTLGFHLAFHTNKMATNKKKLLLLQNFIPWWQILTPRLLCVLDILVQIMMHSDIFHVNESNKKIIGSPFGLKTH